MRNVVMGAIALLAGCCTPVRGAKDEADNTVSVPPPPPREQITLDNGELNRIDAAGVTRNGASFTFARATVADDSWIVVHPFKDGRPNGDIYVGNTFLAAGSHQDVEVIVKDGAETGQMFLVMLHKDADQDGVFDFVFVDDTSVEDYAVFEGTTMIAHIFAAP